MKIEIQKTEDGSHTLFRPDLNETYHSHKGAMGESMHVFMNEGLKFFSEARDQQPINIFEVGLGTGLNAWLAYKFSEKTGKPVSYVGLEPFPVPEDIWSALNYTDEKEAFNRLHLSGWNEPHVFSPSFAFMKVRGTLELHAPKQHFDIVFMDAFAPGKQPEVWSRENLAKCYAMLEPGGILVTYCAQGQFKRDLKAIGFSVASPKGALGKKEMVRATKPLGR